jgi:hypothetical protein
MTGYPSAAPARFWDGGRDTPVLTKFTDVVKTGSSSRMVTIDADVTVPAGTSNAWSAGDARHASAVRALYANESIVTLACCGVDYTSISNLIGSHPGQKENAPQSEALPKTSYPEPTSLTFCSLALAGGERNGVGVSFHVRRRR